MWYINILYADGNHLIACVGSFTELPDKPFIRIRAIRRPECLVQIGYAS